MTTAAIRLPTPGARIGRICGPCESAKDDAGVVLCQIDDRWGSHVVVLMDDGSTNKCHGLTERGIGWYAL